MRLQVKMLPEILFASGNSVVSRFFIAKEFYQLPLSESKAFKKLFSSNKCVTRVLSKCSQARQKGPSSERGVNNALTSHSVLLECYLCRPLFNLHKHHSLWNGTMDYFAPALFGIIGKLDQTDGICWCNGWQAAAPWLVASLVYGRQFLTLLIGQCKSTNAAMDFEAKFCEVNSHYSTRSESCIIMGN